MSQETIDISKYTKAQVLKALYDKAKAQGMGFLQAVSDDMSLSQAEDLLKVTKYFDYCYGRVMKVDLSDNNLNPRLYDRDNGTGAAARAIAAIAP